MKRYISSLMAVAMVLTSCALLPSGGDPVVVNAEKSVSLAADSFDAFVTFEYNNRAALLAVSPAVKQYADVIRAHGQQWLVSARDLTKAYKLNKSADNKANLSTALAVLAQAVAEIQSYTSASAVKLNKMSGGRH